jgi:hypothetical protein
VFLEEGNIENNPLLSFCKSVILLTLGGCFSFIIPCVPSCCSEVAIPRQGRDPVVYKDYESLEKGFLSKEFHPLDLKDAVTASINKVSR